MPPPRQADDVGQLVNVGVICYLKQLLDTGFFHADPHPGNLIRTPDGRLAILDFGLMTEVRAGLRVASRLAKLCRVRARCAHGLPGGQPGFGLMTEVFARACTSRSGSPFLRAGASCARAACVGARAARAAGRLRRWAHDITPCVTRPRRAQVDDGIKYGMIEAISHLIHRDYDAIVLVGGRCCGGTAPR